MLSAARSISVIGGADGPTSIFIAGKIGGGFTAGIILTAVIVGVAAVFLYRKKKRK